MEWQTNETNRILNREPLQIERYTWKQNNQRISSSSGLIRIKIKSAQFGSFRQERVGKYDLSKLNNIIGIRKHNFVMPNSIEQTR